MGCTATRLGPHPPYGSTEGIKAEGLGEHSTICIVGHTAIETVKNGGCYILKPGVQQGGIGTNS